MENLVISLLLACICSIACGQFCFNTYAVWVSRYRHHTPSEVDAAFSGIASMGITRVYFNVWAEGTVYYNSGTATANGATFGGDRLSSAIDAARRYGLEIYAWFEYGNMADYGGVNNNFAIQSDSKGWLLYNIVNGQRVYTVGTPGAGNFVWMDPTQQGTQDFISGIVADAVSNYNLDGIQIDDHFGAPTGFDAMDSLPQSQKFAIMKEFSSRIYATVKTLNPGVMVSYSPSPLGFSRSWHNVDWARYYVDYVVDDLFPQYYRTTNSAFVTTLDDDLPQIPSATYSVNPGIRLSGASSPPVTPSGEVDAMLMSSYNRNLPGISFWFIDDLLNGNYSPPPLNQCKKDENSTLQKYSGRKVLA